MPIATAINGIRKTRLMLSMLIVLTPRIDLRLSPLEINLVRHCHHKWSAKFHIVTVQTGARQKAGPSTARDGRLGVEGNSNCHMEKRGLARDFRPIRAN